MKKIIVGLSCFASIGMHASVMDYAAWLGGLVSGFIVTNASGVVAHELGHYYTFRTLFSRPRQPGHPLYVSIMLKPEEVQDLLGDNPFNQQKFIERHRHILRLPLGGSDGLYLANVANPYRMWFGGGNTAIIDVTEHDDAQAHRNMIKALAAGPVAGIVHNLGVLCVYYLCADRIGNTYGPAASGFLRGMQAGAYERLFHDLLCLSPIGSDGERIKKHSEIVRNSSYHKPTVPIS